MISLVCMALWLVADSVATQNGLSPQTYAHSEVAFMATLSQDQNNVQLHQKILYDRVITNIGNAYNSQTGDFRCPVSGTYLFNFNVMAGDCDYVEARLRVNGAPIVHALSDQRGGSIQWDMGTTNAILQLRKNDYVNVAIQWPEGKNSLHGNKYNTFSGYLLRASM